MTFFAEKLKQDLPNLDPVEALELGMKQSINCGHVFYGAGSSDESLSDLIDEVRELETAIKENEGQTAIRNELGDVLQSLINISRQQNIAFSDVETAIAERWINRKALQEQKVREAGYTWKNLPISLRDATWKEVKTELKEQEYKD